MAHERSEKAPEGDERERAMSDDLDDLKNAFAQVTPAPDAKRRLENITLAQENFARLQGSREEPRPISDAPKLGGFGKGLRAMFDALSSEGINIKVITTSEIKISVLIDRKYMELAVQALHDVFELEKAA